MNKTIKLFTWTLFAVALVAGIAAPKVMPLLKSSSKPTADAQTTAGPKEGGGKRKKGGDAPLKVATFVVAAAPFAETVTSTGSVRADEGVELQAETTGRVVAINFTEGRQVHKGDLLLKLNDADLKATLQRTEFSKQLALLKEQRYKQLLGQHMVTQNDYDTALSDVNVQQANIDLYKAQIEKTEVRAPFDGVVGLRYVSLGAYVNASTRIATLQRVDKLKIDFAIPEKYVGRVKTGNPISFNIAGGDRKFIGQIYAIDPRIDAATRTLVIRAECDNREGRLLPGAFANVELNLEEINDAVLIPSEAVVPGLDEKNVYVLSDGKAEQRAVQTGTRTSTKVHVLAGLKPGEVIITSGLQQMRAGMSVMPIDGDSGGTSDIKRDDKGTRKKKLSTNLAGATTTTNALGANHT